MKITLRFIGLGYRDSYQARVKIYNKNHELLIDDITYNGTITFKGCNKEIYIIKVNYFNGFVNIPLYINNQYTYEFILFKNQTEKTRLITFLLTDANYLGLYIKKGEIIYG